MTTTDAQTKFRYEGNGTTATFAFNGRIFSDDDLIVEIILRSDDSLVETLTPTDYSVTINSPSSASVTVTTPNIPTALQDIQIRRNLAKTQSLVLPTGTVFPAKAIETAFDRITAIAQELQTQIDLKVGLDITDSGEPPNITALMDEVTEQAATATAQAAIATTKAGEASTSASAASASASAASGHASTASGHASTATTQATNAASSASTATTQAGIATTQATNAAGSASTATTQAGIATTQATNAAASAATAAAAIQGYNGTSTTNIATFATDPTTFSTQSGKLWALGQRLRAASDDGTKILEGEVLSYSGTNLEIDVDYMEGTGPHADWNISLTGARGDTGSSGSVGDLTVNPSITPAFGDFLVAADVSNSNATSKFTVSDLFGTQSWIQLRGSAFPAVGDEVAIGDASASNAIRKTNIQGFLNTDGWINGTTTATIVATDQIIFGDVSASNVIRKATVQDILNLVPAPSVGGWIPIKTTTVSTPVTSVDFVNGSGGVVLDGTYKAYAVVLTNVVPSSDGVVFFMRTSTDGGVTFDSGASDYAFSYMGYKSGGAESSADDTSTEIRMHNQGLGSSSGENLNGIIHIFNPASTTLYTSILSEISMYTSTPNMAVFKGAGARLAAANVDAIRFFMSSDNIASGTFTLFGLEGA